MRLKDCASDTRCEVCGAAKGEDHLEIPHLAAQCQKDYRWALDQLADM